MSFMKPGTSSPFFTALSPVLLPCLEHNRFSVNIYKYVAIYRVNIYKMNEYLYARYWTYNILTLLLNVSTKRDSQEKKKMWRIP